MHVHIMKKEIKKIVGMRWSAFGRQHNVMKINIPLSIRRKVNNSTCFIIYGSNMFLLYMDQICFYYIWISSLESYESPGTKTSKCPGEWR